MGSSIFIFFAYCTNRQPSKQVEAVQVEAVQVEVEKQRRKQKADQIRSDALTGRVVAKKCQ